MTIAIETPTISSSLVKPAVKPASPPTPRRLTDADVGRVEIALARGVSAHDVLAIWGITYAQLQTIRDRMASTS